MNLIYSIWMILLLSTVAGKLNQQNIFENEFEAQDGQYRQQQYVQENYDDSGQNEDFRLANQQQEYLNQFAAAMSDFFPLETFFFNLTQYEEQTFIFWPSANTSQLRGIFYIAEGYEGESQGEVSSGLDFVSEDNGKVVKEFSNKRLGVFQVPFTQGHMNLKFRSNLRDLKIYLSYELKTKKQQKVEFKTDQNAKGEQIIETPLSPMKKLLQRFKRVDMELSGQQSLIRNINHFSIQQYQRMEKQFYWGKFRIVLETFLVVLSGSVCLYLLYRKLASGYQLLV